jgi:hypothetical protein
LSLVLSVLVVVLFDWLVALVLLMSLVSLWLCGGGVVWCGVVWQDEGGGGVVLWWCQYRQDSHKSNTHTCRVDTNTHPCLH